MNWSEFWQAFNEGRETMRQADRVADDMAYMLSGRLRNVQGHRLATLKLELRDFNIRTKKWKDEA